MFNVILRVQARRRNSNESLVMFNVNQVSEEETDVKVVAFNVDWPDVPL